MKNSEKWKGKYSYKLDDGSQSMHINFELNIEINNDNFSGVSVDDEYKEICDVHPVVRGFMDNNFISFVIIYPYAYTRNDFGELELNKETKNYKVEYEGCMTDVDRWSGEWIAIFESIKTTPWGDYQESFIVGDWELNRI